MAGGKKAKYVGKVRLIQRIGHGSMGVVYRGFHEELEREVAIKILSHRDDDTQRRILRRFQREGKAAATVDHPNVVRVYESAEYHGRPYIVMELVDGASLGNVLDRKGRVPLAQAGPIAVAIAEGLAAIHAAGIIHRDVKPDNILLGRGGVVKITDLGLARYLDDPGLNRLTATGVVVGTPLYVSPESISDTLTAGPEADIYSLGATIYHMIAGRPPFDGSTPYELMKYHLQYEPVPIGELVPELPDFIAEAIMACLEKDPRQRPKAARLAAMLQGRKLRTVRATRRLVLTVVAVVLAAAAAAWFAVAPRERAPARLVLEGLPPDAEWCWTNDDWRRYDGGPVSLPAGDHVLKFRAYEPNGRLLAHEEVVELAAGSDEVLDLGGRLAYRQADQPDWTVPYPGIVYRLGKPGETRMPLSLAGSYWVSAWTGRTCHTVKLEVTPHGVYPGPWRESRAPDARAYFIRPEAGSPLPPHHLVCWGEIAFLARHLGKEPPRGPEDRLLAAGGISEEWVRDWVAWRHQDGVRLPDAAEGRHLSAARQVPVYVSQGEEIGIMGSELTTPPHLIAVPVEALP